MRQPILSASLLILMIMLSVMLLFRKLIALGVHILFTASPVTTMLSYLDLAPSFFSWAVRLSTSALMIGDIIIFGFVPQSASLSEF